MYGNRVGSRMRCQFDQISVLTLYIRKDKPEHSVNPDQTPQNAASDLGLHCLPLIQQLYTRSQVTNVLVEEKYKVKSKSCEYLG